MREHHPVRKAVAGRPKKARSVSHPYLLIGVLAALAFAAATIGIVVTGRTLSTEFVRVEDNLATQKANQMLMGLEADLRQLRVSNRDFAQWDDAEKYALNGNRAFTDTNFVYETLQNLEVDVVWIGDASGREVFSTIIDDRRRSVTSPAPAEVTHLLNSLPARTDQLAGEEPSHSMMRTPLGVMAFSIWRICSSDGTRQTGQWMLFGRFLQADDLARAANNSHMRVSMVPLSAAAAKDPRLPVALRTLIASPDQSVTAQILDDRHIQSIALLRDLDDRPLAYLRSTMTRDISSLGRKRTWGLLGVIAALLAAFGSSLLVLIWRLRASFARENASETRYRKIADQLQELLVLADAATQQVTELNPAARAALGYGATLGTTLKLSELFPALDIEALINVDSTAARRQSRETTMRRVDGRLFDVEFSVTVIVDQERRLACFSARDISEKRQAEEQRRESQRKLIHIAHHDQLTKLPNRMYLHTKLPQVIKKMAERSELKLGLVYLDVDNFKNINDGHGHGCGDQLLQIVASRLRACVQMQDVVVRMGGDEFVIIAPMLRDRCELDAMAQRVQTAIQAPMHVDGHDITTSTSMGIAVYPDDGREMDVLLKHADIALYQAKEAGRRCHRFFSADMNLRVSEDLALEQALRHAVGTSQIHVEYQPVVALDSGRLMSLEALARWRHPEQGIIPPAQFIPVAERSGLIVDLGEQVLRKVVRQLRTWLDDGLPIAPVAVNVSPLQLERTDFATLAQSVAEASGLEMKWLRFEITESALLKNPEKLIGTLQTLRSMGSKILIDDFGTGYSSLNYLHRLPVDTVKIDRSFVTQLQSTGGNSAVINAVVNMARTLGLNTVAEGIETIEQHAWLMEMGCDMGQGYFYSRPVNANHCAALFQNLGAERKLTETVMVRSLRSG